MTTVRTRTGSWTGRSKWVGGTIVALVTLGSGTAAVLHACGGYGDLELEVIVDPGGAQPAIDRLRKQGPAGLRRLMRACAEDIRRHGAGGYVGTPDEAMRWKRITAAIDAVAAQKDAAYSGLYWYTDFEQAKAAARKQGKPILSLRLLGNLDEELSCANSRFFRTVLYADEEVGNALRERYVLHWKSVRPVPKVTIDMGDGRVICRTITGNSIHYVLDADGRTVDALPGLYGPKDFLRGVEAAGQIEKALRETRTNDDARASMLARWHESRIEAIEQAWTRDLSAITTPASLGSAGKGAPIPAQRRAARTRPTALESTPLATAKAAAGEIDLVRALAPRVAALEASTNDAAWAKIAALPAHRDAARLGTASRAMVRLKHASTDSPSAQLASRLAIGKRMQEDPLVRVVSKFERSVAEDSVRNEYGFHRKIHEWFAAQAETARAGATGPDELNEKVYAELFLTPSSDPWLGLVPEDAYSALEADAER